MSFYLDEKQVSRENFFDGAKLAKKIKIYNESNVAALPEMPAVTYFWAYNLPLVAALPEMPAVTDFWADNLPLVEKKKK